MGTVWRVSWSSVGIVDGDSPKNEESNGTDTGK